MNRYTVGTRGSKLSVAQTCWVIQQLESKNPDTNFTISKITTKGDIDTTRPLFAIDQKGIFEKEIDQAVSNNSVDLAVHSLKDVPSELPSGLVLACIPKRKEPHDIFISKNGEVTLDSIPPGSTIGTSSLRRAVQVSTKRSDLRVKPIRGNIETRINKVLLDGSIDAIILAKAGISRLGLDVAHHVLSTMDFIPSPGQGALGLVCRQHDQNMISILKSIEDCDTRLEVESERVVSHILDSGCRFPVGAHATIVDNTLTLHVIAFSVDGKKSISVVKSGPKTDATQIGMLAAKQLQEDGIQKLALNWRAKVEEWNNKNG